MNECDIDELKLDTDLRLEFSYRPLARTTKGSNQKIGYYNLNWHPLIDPGRTAGLVDGGSKHVQ